MYFRVFMQSSHHTLTSSFESTIPRLTHNFIHNFSE